MVSCIIVSHLLHVLVFFITDGEAWVHTCCKVGVGLRLVEYNFWKGLWGDRCETTAEAFDEEVVRQVGACNKGVRSQTGAGICVLRC